MDRLQEKTTAPYPPVGADGGQSLSQKPNQSIAEGVTEHKPPERDLEEIMRQISRVNDPAYLPTVSMNDLYEQVYPGRPPVVDGLLYAGTYLFVGAPKVGKSFLMAQLAYHVSMGLSLWGYEVRQGTVLYLALEDDHRRLQERLYRMFGVNAELLIDHAWGYEPCTIADVKAYKPENHSVGSGQVLACPYTVEKAKLVVREMADLLALDLVDKKLTTDQVVLTVGYDIENLTDPKRKGNYGGEIVTDRYGRRIPKHAHGSKNLGRHTSSTKRITDAVMSLYDEIMNPKLLVRRIALSANHVACEGAEQKKETYEQLDLFTDYGAQLEQKKKEAEDLAREKRMQQAVLEIKKKFGKNAILKGMNLEEGATAVTRNSQIGGHRA